MEIQWKGQVQIRRPVSHVFAYLADFRRHVEWAQTLVKVEQVRGGDSQGVGAVYLAYERQALQADRRPGEALMRGLEAKTQSTITEIVPDQRIVWKAHTLPKTGMYATWWFELAATPDGGTMLSQGTYFHQPSPMAFIFSLIFRGDLLVKSYAQFDASLKNLKIVMEGHAEATDTASSKASVTIVTA